MSEPIDTGISLKMDYDPLLDELEVTVEVDVAEPTTTVELQDGLIAVFGSDGSLVRMHAVQAGFARSHSWRTCLSHLIGTSATRRLDQASQALLPLSSRLELADEEAAITRQHWARAVDEVQEDLREIGELLEHEAAHYLGISGAAVQEISAVEWLRAWRERAAQVLGEAVERVLTYKVSFLPAGIRAVTGNTENLPVNLDPHFADRAGVDPRGELRLIENGVKVVFNPTSTSTTLAVAYANSSADDPQPLRATKANPYEVEAELPPALLRSGEDVLELVFFTLT